MTPVPVPSASATQRVRRSTLRGLGVLVLVCGLGLSAWVFARSAVGQDASGYEVIDGVAYPRPVEDTKAYNRQMELYGGKGLVLAQKLEDWLAGLGRSKSFAALLALCTVLGAGRLFYAAGHPVARLDEEEQEDRSGRDS